MPDTITLLQIPEIEQLITQKFKAKGRNPDPRAFQQIIGILYQECKPDQRNIRPEQLLYDEKIVQDILSRLQL